MPLTVHLDENTRWLHIIGHGKLTIDDFRHAVESHVPDSSQLNHGRVFVDFSDASPIDISSNELQDLADHVATTLDDTFRGRTAVLVGNDLNFGLGRMYQVFSEGQTIEIEIFRDRGEATKWLGGGEPASTD